MSDSNEFLKQLYGKGLVEQLERERSVLDRIFGGPMTGRIEPIHTDEEWTEIEAYRLQRFEQWRRLTDELLSLDVLNLAHCYECAGEPVLNNRRPVRLVEE